MEKQMTELKKEKVLLENHLEMEKMKVEAEKKKLILAHEQLREKVSILGGESVMTYVAIFSQKSTRYEMELMICGKCFSLFLIA